jgi:hypothetical protein
MDFFTYNLGNSCGRIFTNKFTQLSVIKWKETPKKSFTYVSILDGIYSEIKLDPMLTQKRQTKTIVAIKIGIDFFIQILRNSCGTNINNKFSV